LEWGAVRSEAKLGTQQFTMISFCYWGYYLNIIFIVPFIEVRTSSGADPVVLMTDCHLFPLPSPAFMTVIFFSFSVKFPLLQLCLPHAFTGLVISIPLAPTKIARSTCEEECLWQHILYFINLFLQQSHVSLREQEISSPSISLIPCPKLICTPNPFLVLLIPILHILHCVYTKRSIFR